MKGVDYPADKEALIQAAKKQGADEEMIFMLEQLSEDEEFETPTDVSAAIGELE